MQLGKYIQQAAIVTITTIIITGLLRTIIKRDSLAKVLILGFTISLISVLTYEQQNGQGINVWYWMACTNLMIVILGLFRLVFKVVSTNAAVQHVAEQYIQTFSKEKTYNLQQIATALLALGLLTISIILYIFLADILQIIREYNLLLSAALIILSLAILYCLQRMFKQSIKQQAIKRKFFHIGPLIMVPLINYLNQNVLVLFLSAGFYLFFVLELIRYAIKLAAYKFSQQNRISSKVNLLKYIFQQLTVLFEWMSKFNSRQKQFWFTHLFLISSLLLSYSLGQTNTSMSGHIVLCLIAADAMAAVVGKKIGTHKIYDEKTLEGSLAFILAFLASYSLIDNQVSMLQKLIVSVCCCVGQLYSGDADNIITLLVFLTITMIIRLFY